jgi:hypothetical protein
MYRIKKKEPFLFLRLLENRTVCKVASLKSCTVRTVLGDIPSDQLGIVYAQEHRIVQGVTSLALPSPELRLRIIYFFL